MKTKRSKFTWLIDALTIRKRSDAKIIFMCFLAATTFWFLNALNKDYTTRLTYPIQFQYDDSTYVAVTPPPKRVSLNVSGYGWNLLRKSIKVGADPLVYRLANPTQVKHIAGQRLLPTINEQLADIRVNYVVDDTISFDIDRRTTKKVALKVDSTQINLAPNHRIVSNVTVEPDTIVYAGPESLLKALPDEIYLEVPARGIDEDYSGEIVVNYVQSSLINTNFNKVQVSFDVAEYVREVRRAPVQLLNLAARKNDFTLIDNQVDVVYWVRREDAGRVRAEDFRVVADFETFKASDSTVVISVEQRPNFVSNVSLSRNTAKVRHED